MANLAGKSLGKYQITDRLGKGGMAEVYKAHHPNLDRTVAVKVLHGYLAEGEDFLGRFKREARAVASLRHPHIVQIHDFDVDEATYYMVMEFIDGGTLQDRMNDLRKSGKYMTLEQVLAILKQVAGALDYAHKKGIIHRDIKPSNILLDDSGEAFLADFGIARMVSTTQFTSTGGLIGTPTYMSPEQGKGEELTPASDIYSLGVILYELLTGQAPFVADTPLAVIQKHVNEPLPPPGALRPTLPGALEGVVKKALAKDPAMRYQSAGEMAQAVAQALAGEDIRALDKEQVGGKAAFTVQPTEKMDTAELPSKAPPPTVAMGEQTRAEIAGEKPDTRSAELQLKPEPTPVSGMDLEPEAMAKKPGRAAKDKKVPVRTWKERLSSKPVLFGFIGLVIVVAVVIVMLSQPKTTECQSLEACIALADEMLRQQNPEGAIEAFQRAGDMVPTTEHQQNAWIWCTRADLLDQAGRHDEAAANRNICTIWQGGG